ncbi:MAG: hypothetical protein KDA41_14225, partial [Planctomycetales bacterium]|nr:hypothetical protein [Planctomycetales bacterium]
PQQGAQPGARAADFARLNAQRHRRSNRMKVLWSMQIGSTVAARAGKLPVAPNIRAILASPSSLIQTKFAVKHLVERACECAARVTLPA